MITEKESIKFGELAATTSIHCTEIASAKLAKMLKAATVGPKDFVLNGASWQLTMKGRFKGHIPKLTH